MGELTKEEKLQHIKNAGLGSLLRRIYFKSVSELSSKLGLSEDETLGLMKSQRDLDQELAVKLCLILGLDYSDLKALKYLI